MIIDGLHQPLPRSQVSLRGLYGAVTEQELNLFEFTSGTVAEPSAGTTKIVRRQVIHSDPLCISLYCYPNNIRSDPTT